MKINIYKPRKDSSNNLLKSIDGWTMHIYAINICKVIGSKVINLKPNKVNVWVNSLQIYGVNMLIRTHRMQVLIEAKSDDY